MLRRRVDTRVRYSAFGLQVEGRTAGRAETHSLSWMTCSRNSHSATFLGVDLAVYLVFKGQPRISTKTNKHRILAQ